ncbi:NUDIX hydrolase [Formosa algae]|uniref:8-oxo-dGTP pyrophosphatase MutT (NUDIX family) n=1 Tax=Formosa algae TaxID=225843 RepID=A0A9X0YM80_9FLAO|nr:CoA pyrophosphatase [Formosa algae]MBP1841590.1 8-oxo-dGTP pyrophosphatase MutT (NUDIX family) [Formosa algae]MDQ0337017.1 8-oxo-dGTP pyrophosphatase MutT (NUDIX family) [Formosa algae]OEI80214.1 coenzyme A pyrophosphatase [Formosa algae]
MNFDDFIKLRSKIENIPLPAEASQFKMSPPFREDLLEANKIKMKTARKAAVMALFYPNNLQQTHLVLILRNTYKGVHSAQIGFPGGKLEPEDDSLKTAAIRETFEEVGVPERDINVWRKITDIYIPPSHFVVQPFIGIAEKTPIFLKQDIEVDAIIEVPLVEFLSEKNVVTKRVTTSYAQEIDVPAFVFQGHVVWGATAMMLSEVKDILKQVRYL